MSKFDFSDDTFKEVELLWSEKYAMPVYKVGELYFAPDTGQYAGYYTKVNDLVLKDLEVK